MHNKFTSRNKDDSTDQNHWVGRNCTCVYANNYVHLTILFMQSKGVPQFYGLYFAMGKIILGTKQGRLNYYLLQGFH